MPTNQDILNDVDLIYRNTFTPSQKIVWFNEELLELFDILEVDSPPYAFVTVGGQNYYPFPDQFDVSKIKTVTYQVNDIPNFIEIDFKRNDDKQGVMYGEPWYTIVSNTMFLYTGGTVPDNRKVYIFTDSEPTLVTLSNLPSTSDLPVKYQEILKLGILKRIAMARKDAQIKSNYEADYEQKLADVLWQKKLAEPEWTTPIDVLPHAGHSHYHGRYWG